MIKQLMVRYLLGAVLLPCLALGWEWAPDTLEFHDSGFDSELLRLKVPEAFAQSSLKLEVFADSSWQLFQGKHPLGFAESLHLLGLTDQLVEYQIHHDREAELLTAYRSRRVFALISGLGGSTYLLFTAQKNWVYQIPGYAALAVGIARYLESRKLEIQALREFYYYQSLISPSDIQRRVDDYNFRLYQYLSNAGIQFREG